MAVAGFTLVMNYDLLYASIANVRGYLDHANKVGVKVMISLQDPVWWKGDALSTFADLAAGCGCTTNATFAEYVVRQVKDHPATWGYYLGDEVSSDIAAAQQYWTVVHQVDQGKPTFIVSAEDEATLGAAISPVADSVGITYLAPDIYPVGLSGDPSKDPLDSVGKTMAHVQGLAEDLGKGTGVVLQAFNVKKAYPDESGVRFARFPSRTEMRTMRDDALASGKPQFILWYSYFDLIQDESSSQYWADLEWAAMGT